MKWHLIIIVALMAALIPGCGGGDSDINVVSDDLEESESPLIDGPAGDVESPDVSEADGFQTPFPTNRSFFRPPEVEKTVALPHSVVAEQLQHADVRVIGFSQIGDGEPQALVSIRGHLESVRTGDSVNGVTVVALDAPNVTLQQRNERWTISLFKQPVVNRRVAGSTPSRSVARQSTRSAAVRRVFDAGAGSSAGDFAETQRSGGIGGSGNDTLLNGYSSNNLPPAPASLPEESFAPTAELPEELDLPEPPKLPAIDVSVDQLPPGIDELPGLPSFPAASK
jgi:hypothetical protein